MRKRSVFLRQRNLRSAFLGLATVAYAWAQTGGSIPPLETIVARMGEARAENRTKLRPYKVTREYKLFGKEKQKPRSEVIADLSFVPPNVKKFTIQSSSGAALGERIVRQMLEGEVTAVEQYGSTDITAANYNFRFVREEDVDGQRCYVLDLVPKRKDRTLLRGSIWVDARTYRLHRFDGEPAKGPSWWLKEPHIALVYGHVGGMWLQTGSESRANVRIFGPFTMVSRDVRYQVGEPVTP